ncbi:hypothetical protein Tco_0527745 [Tanacetum coccineum]
MHNNIMAAGSRDRPPMLVTGRYAQWRSRFLRYIDTRPNGDALRKCILKGPYTPTIVTTPAVPATEDSPAVPEQTTVSTTVTIWTPENRAHFESEKEAIHLILTGIRDEIYSTVDACQTAQEMWEAIERLQQGESLNIQDVKTNLFWEFGQFTSHDGETIESYYTRFYKMMNEMIRNNLTVATMQVNVQFLQQLQPEWSRFVTIVKQQHKLDENANPLALVATAQTLQDPYYQSSKSHKSYAPTSKASLPTRSHATTRYKGKEIAKPITPPSESASEEDSDPEQAQKDKDMQKNLALIAKYFKKLYKPTNNNLRTSSNTRNKNVDTTPRYKNDNQTGQFGNQRAVNVVGARETVGGPYATVWDTVFNCSGIWSLCKGMQKAKNGLKNSNKCDDGSVVALANLIANLKLDVDENKKIQKQLKKENATLTQELTECKSILAETSRTLGESNSIRDSCLVALQNKQTELRVTPQNLPQTAKQAVRNTNVIKPGMYRIASSTTQTRAPQLNQTSRNTNLAVTTSTETSNVNAVCATCGKCVFNSNHDACVSKFLKDVNARTKKPNVIVQLILFIVDLSNSLGMHKAQDGNLSQLCNFVEKNLGTVRLANDNCFQFLGQGELVQGKLTRSKGFTRIEGTNFLTRIIRGTASL